MLDKIALVIPVHNRRETTLRALRSLRRINTDGLEVKIVVVDDGSTDGTSEAISVEFPEVELLCGDGTLHYAAGTNRGISAALEWGSDYLVTMNDDAIFHEDFLVRLVATARSSGRTIIGSMLLLWDTPHRVFQVDPQWQPFRGGWVFPEGMTAFSAPRDPFEVECLVGNCVLFPVQAIRENGFMDEKTFANGWGDAQYTARMRRAGWKLLVDPISKVWCEPNTYPTPLHRLPKSKALGVLLSDQRHPANLRRQFQALWHSGPTKLGALVAFASYTAGLALKALRVIPYAERRKPNLITSAQ